ncbi:MAG: phosphoglycerate kinase, partial [Candidatus Thermoplasmatota archaeon]
MLPKMRDFNFSEKSVILRLDINSPLDPKTLKIIDRWRIEKAIPTIIELKEKNAKQIIIAHQGRPGDWDFTD